MYSIRSHRIRFGGPLILLVLLFLFLSTSSHFTSSSLFLSLLPPFLCISSLLTVKTTTMNALCQLCLKFMVWCLYHALISTCFFYWIYVKCGCCFFVCGCARVRSYIMWQIQTSSDKKFIALVYTIELN